MRYSGILDFGLEAFIASDRRHSLDKKQRDGTRDHPKDEERKCRPIYIILDRCQKLSRGNRGTNVNHPAC